MRGRECVEIGGGGLRGRGWAHETLLPRVVPPTHTEKWRVESAPTLPPGKTMRPLGVCVQVRVCVCVFVFVCESVFVCLCV